jgi:hypothetical protein
MDEETLQTTVEQLLPSEVIREAVEALGVQERQRKRDVVALVYALVLTGGSPFFGYQAKALDTYVRLGAPRVSRAAFYQWFTGPFAALFAHLGQRACAWAASRPVHLPGPLAGVTDWRAFDSTTVKLPDELFEAFAGAGDYAALKVHKEYSLGTENVVDYSISAARDHDARHLVVDERRRGSGLVVDLGYASHDMLRACQRHDVKVIIRLKKGWHVWFDEGVDDATINDWLDDLALDSRFDLTQLEKRAPDEPLDVDVTLGPPGATIRMRLVSVPTEKGHCVFLTNLPRSTHSYALVGLIYRLRWCIEVDNKLNKSAFQLENIEAKTLPSALTLVHASMIASVIANGLAHEVQLKRGNVGAKRAAAKQAPLHPLTIASVLCGAAESIGRVLADPDPDGRTWRGIAASITVRASDPNWRRKPSAIDVVKGRTPRLLDPAVYAKKPVHALGVLK